MRRGSWLERMLLFSVAFFIFSCVPDTFLEREIEKNGKVKYRISATSNANEILVERAEETREVYNGEELTFPIILGENAITATASNQWGNDPTPAEDSFYSPTKSEAREIIEEFLVQKGCLLDYRRGVDEKHFVRDYPLSLGDRDFVVDYWGRINGRYLAITYAEQDLEQELLNATTLSEFRIPNIYFFRDPIENITAILDNLRWE